MSVIGLTGGIASGKSSVSKMLKQKGYYVIDCDQIVHDIQKKPHKCFYEIIKEFGNDILIDDIISRNILRDMVFNDENKLKKLNDIIHPIVYDEVKSLINKDLVFIDCPLLFETNFIDLCDKTVVVYSNYDVQLDRLIKRNKISKEDAIKRINLQMSLEDKKNKANYVIMNNKSLDDLEKQVNIFLKEV